MANNKPNPDDCSYYVYRHLRNDVEQPFYIGKGKKPERFRQHSSEFSRACTTSGRNRYWENIVNKAGSYETEILMDELTEQEAFNKEKEFIALYGRVNNKTGILCNLTDGGEGTGAVVVTEEQWRRALATKRANGYVVSEETKRKISIARTGIKTPHSEETKKKIGAGNKGRIVSQESRDKMRKTQEGRKQGQAQRDNARLAWVVKHGKPTLSIETGFVFDSCADAAIAIFPHRPLHLASDAISKACREKIPKAYGHKFCYV